MNHRPSIRLSMRCRLITALALLCGTMECCRPSPAPSGPRKVYIGRSGGRYAIFLDGQPFTVKGAAGAGQLKALKAAGGNTLRTWDTVQLGALLDEARAEGIAVIAGLSIPVSSSLDFYRDTAAVAALCLAYQQVVDRYKNHPALLMWCLGNEVDFPYRPRFQPFYKGFNRLLGMIHDRDPDHPVTTTVINFNRRNLYNLRWKVPRLDLVSLNIFGSLQHLRHDLREFAWFWNGPYLITEWGINGPWETETTAWGAPIEKTGDKKAEQYLLRYKEYMPQDDPRFLGACVFYWGQKQEVTHTWFSLFARNGAASAAAQTMQTIWTNRPPAHPAPAFRHLLLEGKGARDNILLSPGTVHSAEVLVENAADSLRFEWEILPEDWLVRFPNDVNPVKPPVLDSLLLSPGGARARFRAPLQEGPYRIFVTAYDTHGNFTSTNTPFYVVAP